MEGRLEGGFGGDQGCLLLVEGRVRGGRAP